MAFGALLGANPGYTKEQTYSTATQAMYPSGTDLPDQALALLSKAIVESQDGTELKNLTGEVIASLPLSGAQTETGSYVGTGTYGRSNKNTLTFDFEPKLLIVQNTTGGALIGGFVWTSGVTAIQSVFTSDSSGAHLGIAIAQNGSTIQWYSSNSTEKQMNISDSIYSYIAVG